MMKPSELTHEPYTGRRNISDVEIAWRLWGDAPAETSAREREQVTVHNLVKEITASRFTLTHDEHGAPRLIGCSCRPPGDLSVTHCAEGAAIAYSDHHIVGIDMETPRQQLERVKERFLSADELEIYTGIDLLLKAWTAKEAVYKAAHTPGLPLIGGIKLTGDDTALAANHTYRLHWIQAGHSDALICVAIRQ